MTCDLTELSLEVGEVDDTLGRVERPWHKRATALIMASQNGHGEVVEKLLEKGASIDLQNKCGFNALLYASLKGHIQTNN